MNLHNDKEAFHDLSVLAAENIGIPVTAVKRDYYIVMMLQKLAESQYAARCVFKGGTSLSKCYPGSIMRFSEDIDLTYIPDDSTSKKQYDKALKGIEKVMSSGANIEKILDAIARTKVRLRANVNLELALELLFLTIREK